MNDSAPLPETVRAVVANAPATQAGILWPRRLWVERFPQFGERLRTLPDHIDRASVREAATAATSDPQAAQWAFLTVMVWGYGSTGYGPWRVQQMFASIERPGMRLCKVARTLREEGAAPAYSLLAGAARMTKLGPAFGTKFLYFCPQPEAPPRALVLDRLVADWLRINTEVLVNPVPWSLRKYQRYLVVMHSWAESLGVPADGVERSIFQAQAEIRGGQWSMGDA